MEGLHKYVLFYSTNCQYCRQFLKIVEENGLEGSFTKVNIDFTDDIPSFVTHVPTVLVDKTSKISGEAVFGWAKKLTEKSSLQPMTCDQLSDPYSFISDGPNQDIHMNYSMLGCDYGGGPSAGKGSAPASQQQGGPQQSQSTRGGDDLMQKIMDARSNEVPQGVRRV